MARIITHAKAKARSYELYRQLGTINFPDPNKYRTGGPDGVTSPFQRNNEYHNHEVRLADHFHIKLKFKNILLQ